MRLCLLLIALLLLPTGAQAASFADALLAYRQNKVADARRIYAEVLADAAASADDRAGAARELARIAWLIDGDANAALAELGRAETVGAGLCDTGILTARVLREAERLQEAVTRGRAAIARCDNPAKSDQIRLQIIAAELALAAGDAAGRQARLQTAAADWHQLGVDAATGPRGAELGLDLGLLSGDAETALQAWRSFFWLTDSDAPQALAGRDVAGAFRNGLRAGATAADRLALADLLVTLGFATETRHFIAVQGLPGAAAGDPLWRKVSTYLEQRRRLEALMLDLNRRMARHGQDLAFQNRELARLERDTAPIWDALAAGLPQPAVPPGASADERHLAILRGYGMFGTSVGTTSGYPSLHLGHMSGDHREHTELYGQSGEIRFIELDNMLANGFESWLWDGSGASGGWAADGTIVQVRALYTAAPMRAFALLGDGPARREMIANQPRLAREDLERLRAAPVAELRGLQARLYLQMLDRVAAVARARGGDFRTAFLSEYYHGLIRQSIYLHETRHIVDGRLHVDDGHEAVPSTGLEYRAKLTELGLSDYPRMAFWNMIDANIGAATSHGQANARIMELYRSWIEAHGSEVMGYDPAMPALAQVDKLTDDQIRAIAQGADPLARAFAGGRH